jgi:hypothetical protein
VGLNPGAPQHGYRSENRYIVFQCLVHTISLPNEQWRVLSDAHRKRNVAEYEGHRDIEESQVDAICRVTEEVAARVTRLVEQDRSGNSR